MYDPSSLYVDPILSNFATGFRPAQYYGDRIFPITTVGTKSGQYRVFDRSNRLIFLDRREPGTVANEIVGRKWSLDTFKTIQHALQSPVLDEERRELASLGGLGNPTFGGAITIDPEQDAVELIVGSLDRGHEKKVADLARNTATYPVGNTVTLAGAQQFDDYTNGVTSTSNPESVIKVAVRTITAKTGFPPNLMLIPQMGVGYIEAHPRITTRYQNFALNIPEAFRVLSGFTGEVVEVGVMDDLYNSADNIDATEALVSMWGKDIWIGYVDNRDGVNVQTFGKTFVYPQPNGENRPVDRWREDARKADLFRQTWEYDLKVVNSSAGYLIKDAFSSTAW